MDFIIYILFGLILIFYITYFSLRKRISINRSVFNYSKKNHFITVLILLCSYILSCFNIYIRGIWTFEIIMWVFIISNFIIQFQTNYLKSKMEKVYFKCLLFCPSILALTWIIPMLGAYTCYSFMLLFNTYEERVIFNDEKYKLSYDEGFLLHDYELKIYSKNYIFERKVKTFILNDMNFEKISKVEEIKKKFA